MTVKKLSGASVTERRSTAGVVWFVNSETIGQGDDDLGRALRKAFFGALAETDAKPSKILLINSGVKLVRKVRPCSLRSSPCPEWA